MTTVPAAVTTVKYLTHGTMGANHIGPVRNILMGMGFAYAVQKQTYWHLPITFIFPTVYAGYHAYMQRHVLREEATAFLKQLR